MKATGCGHFNANFPSQIRGLVGLHLGAKIQALNPSRQSQGLNRDAEPKQISKKGSARSLIKKRPLQLDTQTSFGYQPDLPIKLPTSDLPWLFTEKHIALQSHQNVSS